mmetsp:Transcript_59928/g.192947  ORF Transcript_59928/g.192947 Transcript_59928/m.192947 type:complete len:87 (+) Transcript_59928:919-1179(+)
MRSAMHLGRQRCRGSRAAPRKLADQGVPQRPWPPLQPKARRCHAPLGRSSGRWAQLARARGVRRCSQLLESVFGAQRSKLEEDLRL